MRKILFPTLLLLLGCGREFEPDLTGWKAYTYPGRKIYLEINQRKKTIELPGDEHVGYRYAQWTAGSQLVVTQLTKTNTCFDYQIITIDTTGNILDTVYKAPVNTALNFKLAPNDSLMLLKTYIDNCDGEEGSNYQYTFYNRYLKKAQYDTIVVGSSRGIPLQETIWSPNSKKVIISAWSGFLTEAFTYDLTTKDTTYIDIGGNFQWSPTDHEVVAYIKDHSIYTKNIRSGEKELIYQGKEK
ncbi:MAG TPA: hypothetical protein VGK46_06175, partial [Saprospiraceae bacterium]